MKTIGKILVVILALLGVASLGLDWRKGDVGIFRWDSTKSIQDMPAELFTDFSLSYGVYRVDNASLLVDGQVICRLKNLSSKPMKVNFPPQRYTLQLGDLTAHPDLGDQLSVTGEITLAPNEERELRFTAAGGHVQKLPQVAAFHIIANVDGRFTILSEPRVEVQYR